MKSCAVGAAKSGRQMFSNHLPFVGRGLVQSRVHVPCAHTTKLALAKDVQIARAERLGCFRRVVRTLLGDNTVQRINRGTGSTAVPAKYR